MIYSRLVRPLLFRFDPENVHGWVVGLSQALFALPLIAKAVGALTRVNDPVRLGGIDFPNRIGLAAGFDKNCHFVAAAQALGFGHLEIGAVTPLPQSGHPRPRLFRIAGEASLRNRMGFNNDGAEEILPRLARAKRKRIVVGINLGKGSATPLQDAHRDYLAVIAAAYATRPRARTPAVCQDYFSINISSPNTAELRELGRGQMLRQLCHTLVAGNRREAEHHSCPPRPLWMKISPDSSPDELKELAECAAESGLDGLIATNTTVLRQGRYANLDSAGGLSGEALRQRSLEVVQQLRRTLGAGFPLIGVGGVVDVKSALAMRAAGADLVQLYTGFIYGGPSLPRQLALALKGRR